MDDFDDESFPDHMSYDKTKGGNRIGPIRIIAAKHNQIGDIFKRTTTKIHVDLHIEGFICEENSDDTKDRWYMDDFECEESETISGLLHDMPNGLYEIVGILYHESWTSGYETKEYEFALDVREAKFRKISFYQAQTISSEFFQDEEIDLLRSLAEQHSWRNYNSIIHHFMSELDILRHHCDTLVVLNNLATPWGDRGYINSSDMTKDQCELFIHMTMLNIDSEEEKGGNHRIASSISKQVDLKVRETLDMRAEMFDEQSK